ncbi:MAG: hypothetical protein KF718_17890 [Polyangiaceae bacterium]|nr:hypothetical protein [Polyangiaceae bacterium]
MSKWLSGGTPLVVLLALLGCNQKDQGKCDNGKSVTKQAVASEDFALARQWRDYAYKHCADAAALKALDDEIVSKEAEVTSRKAEQQRVAGETTQLVSLFSGWIGQHRADPTRAAVTVSCKGPEEGKDRWCSRERSVGGKYNVRVTYWEAEPKAHEFFTIAPGEVTCDAFGAATQISEKHGGLQRFCDLTAGGLSGMQLLIRRAKDGTHLNVVSKEYVAKNAAFAALSAP